MGRVWRAFTVHSPPPKLKPSLGLGGLMERDVGFGVLLLPGWGTLVTF